MSLYKSMYCGWRPVQDRLLKGTKAFVQRQQRVQPEREVSRYGSAEGSTCHIPCDCRRAS